MCRVVLAPSEAAVAVNVTFWGVRGSIPTPDSDHMRWGGNTSCLEVANEGGDVLVLDCGTGSRLLGQRLVQRGVAQVDVLMSHVHIDHIVGLPFFAPMHVSGARVTLTLPAFTDEEASEKIARYLNGTLHPLRLSDVAAEVTVSGYRPGERLAAAGCEISACALNHPGGSLAYRITRDNLVFCYVTDTAPLAAPGAGVCAGEAPTPGEQRVISLMRDADFVVFDTMFSEDEYLERMTWGHAYPEYAVALCEAAGARALALFHHLPSADDARMDALAEHWRRYSGSLKVIVAREGDTIDVGDVR